LEVPINSDCVSWTLNNASRVIMHHVELWTAFEALLRISSSEFYTANSYANTIERSESLITFSTHKLRVFSS